MSHSPDFNVDKRVKCPNCDAFMEEVEQTDLTDGQMSDYLAGFNIPFQCPDCEHHDIFDVDVYDYDELDEFEYGDRINEAVFEDLIDRAISKRCFIEVLSLIHNVIELYLKYRIRQHIFKIEGLDEEGLDFSRHKKNEKGEDVVGVSGERTLAEKNARKKFAELFGSGRKYLHDYRELCFVLNLIDTNMNDKIIKFNKDRNKAIHKLLREDESKGDDVKYSQIIETAKLGRKIQLQLSPISHSEQDIKNILKKFEIDKNESKEDKFLSKA